MAKQLRKGEEVIIRSKYDSTMHRIYAYKPGSIWRVENVVEGYGGGAKKAVLVERPADTDDVPDTTLAFFVWPVMLERTEACAAKRRVEMRADRSKERLAGELGTDARAVEGLVAIQREAGLKGEKTRRKKVAATKARVAAPAPTSFAAAHNESVDITNANRPTAADDDIGF